MPWNGKAIIGIYLLIGSLVALASLYTIKTIVQFQYRIYRERKIAEIKLQEKIEREKPKEILEFRIEDITINLLVPRPRISSILLLTAVLRTTDPQAMEYYKNYKSKIIDIFLEVGREFTPKEIESPQFKINFKKKVEGALAKKLEEKTPDSLYFENFITQ